jgi:hypothetical protein
MILYFVLCITLFIRSDQSMLFLPSLLYLLQTNGKTMNEGTSQAKPDLDLDQEPEPDINTQVKYLPTINKTFLRACMSVCSKTLRVCVVCV